MSIKAALEKSIRIKVALQVSDVSGITNNPLSGTIGRLTSPVAALVMGSTAPFGASASLEDPELVEVIEKLKSNPSLKDIKVNLGGVTPIEALSRVWDNKKTSLVSKLLGTLASPVQSLTTSLSRSDSYDPYSDTVTLFNADPAVLRHELGHAEDFTNSGMPIAYGIARNLIPGMDLHQENMASTNALNHMAAELKDLLDGEEKPGSTVIRNRLSDMSRANRVLGGGFGSYVGGTLGGIAGMAFLPQMLAKVKNLPPFLHGAGVPKAIGGLGGAVLGGLLGQLIGKVTRPFLRGESRQTYNNASEMLE